MNAKDEQGDETKDRGEVLPRSSYIETSTVAPEVNFTESDQSLNIARFHQDQFSGDVPKVYPVVSGRSNRQQKKEYVKTLQNMVDAMHSERSEEILQRCVAVQQTAELSKTRRKVVATFLKYHSSYETDRSRWSTVIEESFLLKQPVTPFRSFRVAETEKEYRFSRGMDAIINDAASLSVMLENIGCNSLRWVRIKRENFLIFEESKRCPNRKVPSCVERQLSRLYHSVSSLSASSQSDSSNDDEIECEQEFTISEAAKAEKDGSSKQSALNDPNSSEMIISKQGSACNSNTNKVSSSSGGSGSDGGSNGTNGFNDFHSKHDQSTSDISPSDNSYEKPQSRRSHSTGNTSARVDSSSSGDDSVPPAAAAKRLKTDSNKFEATSGRVISVSISANSKKNVDSRSFPGYVSRHSSTFDVASNNKLSAASADSFGENGPHLIAADTTTALSDFKDATGPKIRGRYIINDDDILSTEDILMCPFVFRSDNAVVCGAFAECVMPGMLRAQFSARNKLQCLELVYDAMGFIQQLERASGSPLPLSSIPGSLGVALSPNVHEARVITLSDPPFAIINVNEVWTRITGYTQMECEGKGYLELLEGIATVPEAEHCSGKPSYLLDRVAKGQPACSTNIHYDKYGRDFIEFVCSYPLTNALDEVTHILHVSRELPSFECLPSQSK